MTYESALETVANWAAILTALVATIAYWRFVCTQWARRAALERHLREEKLASQDLGRRTVMHLMANLAMTEAEGLHDGFQSKMISVASGVDEQGRAVRLYFEFCGMDLPAPRSF